MRPNGEVAPGPAWLQRSNEVEQRARDSACPRVGQVQAGRCGRAGPGGRGWIATSSGGADCITETGMDTRGGEWEG